MLIVSYNIQYGLGRDGQYDLARIAGEIGDADIICLQEVERFWQRSGTVDQAQTLADLLGRYHWVFGNNLDMDASTVDASGRVNNRRRQFGTMILSRWPIVSSRNFPLPKYGTLTQHSIQQGLLETVIDTGTDVVRVYSVHLSHLCAQTRLPQVEAMMDIFARAPLEGGAWCGGHPDPSAGWTEGALPPMPEQMILMGDLNFLPDSAEYNRMIGPKTPHFGRLLRLHGLVDAWVAAGHEEHDGVTHPEAPGRIDHCMLSPQLASRVSRCWIDSENSGSDHYPLWVEISA
ncbi:hydrolase [Rouxiella silvae]|uniref:Endonuclease/exonuclease/phosphatase family protein n=1 Tax=Rouxiella silvae TaxID=1646373 RepID=A0AA41BVE9_9GAMM|nr:endonuclease/exonuclease/phosphatase family protein [Rouxiella silvae]KQN43754.1 hydrolase [Serratia sp. Leaf50]MBF6636150.1 endonuclease/exonuclease/phosphatase family protein [Rouxiella silvae]ORJ18899.1 hydrolase [Rouxiella silvae]